MWETEPSRIPSSSLLPPPFPTPRLPLRADLQICWQGLSLAIYHVPTGRNEHRESKASSKARDPRLREGLWYLGAWGTSLLTVLLEVLREKKKKKKSTGRHPSCPYTGGDDPAPRTWQPPPQIICSFPLIHASKVCVYGLEEKAFLKSVLSVQSNLKQSEEIAKSFLTASISSSETHTCAFKCYSK